YCFFFFFQAEDGIRDKLVTGVQTCALPILRRAGQYGDGLITDPKTWKQHKSEFEAGARAAGKNISAMPVLVEQYAVVGDQQEARSEERRVGKECRWRRGEVT